MAARRYCEVIIKLCYISNFHLHIVTNFHAIYNGCYCAEHSDASQNSVKLIGWAFCKFIDSHSLTEIVIPVVWSQYPWIMNLCVHDMHIESKHNRSDSPPVRCAPNNNVISRQHHHRWKKEKMCSLLVSIEVDVHHHLKIMGLGGTVKNFFFSHRRV